MDLRPLGNSGILASPVIMGTWQAGKAMWTRINNHEIITALAAGHEAGLNAVDTAEVYGNGHSERMVAKALSPVRHQMVYMTKVFANHLGYTQVIKACERSLKNLKTDYLDLYQIHWPAGSFGIKPVPLEETMSALDRLKKDGKIRAIGVSNFSKKELCQALKYGQVDCFQPPYSLFWRHAETDTMPVCSEKGLSVLAYSPMAQGILTGKFGPDHRFDPGDHRAQNRLFSSRMFPVVHKALKKLAPIAARNQITMAQLALAWVLSRPGCFTIAGARNAGQTRENAAAAHVRLEKADLDEMEAISRTVTDLLDDDPVLWKTESTGEKP